MCEELDKSKPSNQERLKRAYLKARIEQDWLEVDLNRSHIVLVDQNGNIIKAFHKSDH